MAPRNLKVLAALLLTGLLLHTATAATISNAGPRVGMMGLSGSAASRAKELNMSPLMSAFGWHMETEFTSTLGAAKGNSSLVLLLVGADQGKALPSATWLVGMRTAEGNEIGMGPNISPAGSGFTVTIGRTRRTGDLNIPVNLSGTFSPHSFRLGLLTGFNTKDTTRPPTSRTITPYQP